MRHPTHPVLLAPGRLALVALVTAALVAGLVSDAEARSMRSYGKRFQTGTVAVHLAAGAGTPTGALGLGVTLDLLPFVQLEGGAGWSPDGARLGGGLGLRYPFSRAAAGGVSLRYGHRPANDPPRTRVGTLAGPSAHWLTGMAVVEGRLKRHLAFRGGAGLTSDVGGGTGGTGLAVEASVGIWF